MVAEGRKRVVTLPDGSTCEVGELQYEAIAELNLAISHVAQGVATNVVIIQNDGRLLTRQRLYSMTAESAGLVEVADALVYQSKIARQIAAEWEGNARGEARSYTEH